MEISKRSGFTLVELMIVVAILGLLLLIAVPNFIRAHSTAAGGACIENLRQLDAAMHTYQINNNAWPTTFNDLVPYIVNSVPTTCPYNGAAYTFETGGGITYTSCPNHGNQVGL